MNEEFRKHIKNSVKPNDDLVNKVLHSKSTSNRNSLKLVPALLSIVVLSISMIYLVRGVIINRPQQNQNTYTYLSSLPADELLDIFINNGLEVSESLSFLSDKQIGQFLKEELPLLIDGTTARNHIGYAEMAKEVKKVYTEILNDPSKLNVENTIITDLDSFYSQTITKKVGDIRDISKEYTSIDMSKSDCCFVSIHSEVFNSELYYEFQTKYYNKQSAFIRIGQTTIEGGLIITDILYDSRSDKIYVVNDWSRDFYSSSEDRIISLKIYNNIEEYGTRFMIIEAEIVELLENQIFVKEIENPEYDKILVRYKSDTDLQVGQMVKIITSGVILESYPPQMYAYHIKILNNK